MSSHAWGHEEIRLKRLGLSDRTEELGGKSAKKKRTEGEKKNRNTVIQLMDRDQTSKRYRQGVIQNIGRTAK